MYHGAMRGWIEIATLNVVFPAAARARVLIILFPFATITVKLVVEHYYYGVTELQHGIARFLYARIRICKRVNKDKDTARPYLSEKACLNINFVCRVKCAFSACCTLCSVRGDVTRLARVVHYTSSLSLFLSFRSPFHLSLSLSPLII